MSFLFWVFNCPALLPAIAIGNTVCFIIYFLPVQFALYWQKTLLWTVYAKYAYLTHSAVLEWKPGRKWMTLFQKLCKFVVCWIWFNEETISRATKSFWQFLSIFSNSQNWSTFCLRPHCGVAGIFSLGGISLFTYGVHSVALLGKSFWVFWESSSK